ncbi:MAG: carboxypeptidase-like regulatory domain-containing protein, partial [Candidatus Marinimicrobia bacterium]|nr:carboxypeptidase-like regulatory domain-containing protein [Candidatus Neomarinimicrobiota bacterium]
MIFSSVLLVSTLFAQSAGKISGRVIDAETGTPLPGANVIVAELETGSATDLERNFAIRLIYLGKYTLKISYIGYA